LNKKAGFALIDLQKKRIEIKRAGYVLVKLKKQKPSSAKPFFNFFLLNLLYSLINPI
jgi:hypothetical protein